MKIKDASSLANSSMFRENDLVYVVQCNYNHSDIERFTTEIPDEFGCVVAKFKVIPKVKPQKDFPF